MRLISVLPAGVLAGAALCLAGYAAIPASATTGGNAVFRQMEGMTYVLGSKRAVGYFMQQNGKCQVTLMIVEAVDPGMGMPPSAARLSLSMMPGQHAGLSSEEGDSMMLTCGANAQTVEVTRSPARSS